MAKFLQGNELNLELERLFENAEEKIILISPFIKLHDRYKSALKSHIQNHKLKIIVVFGKNDDDLSKSMNLDEFKFFNQFPNIEIRYEKRLHAKYYANETSAILTSMNLYGYSQNNNIEAGILTKVTLLGELNEDSIGNRAREYFEKVIVQSELFFEKAPEYDRSLIGLTKKYKSSRVKLDRLSDVLATQSGKTLRDSTTVSIPKFPQVKKQHFNNRQGYCIRTGISIPLNFKRPMCDQAFQDWKKAGSQETPENFCHFSGEKSNGETTYSKPILRKHWDSAKNFA